MTAVLKSRASVEAWLKKMGLDGYTIRDDLTVDVVGNVTLNNKNAQGIPVRFGSVGGNFFCSYNRLTSLSGAPQTVGGNFSCNCNELTNLMHSPLIVHGFFSCEYNQITSLLGGPQSVGKGFLCANNQLASLAGAPESIGGPFKSDFSEESLRKHIADLYRSGRDISAVNLQGLCASVRAELAAASMAAIINDNSPASVDTPKRRVTLA